MCRVLQPTSNCIPADAIKVIVDIGAASRDLGELFSYKITAEHSTITAVNGMHCTFIMKTHSDNLLIEYHIRTADIFYTP
jgi:hypothetical protein